MTKVHMIAGLGFGDEGKGSIVDYLTWKYHTHTVVRYNGGAQAAHNVVLPDGRHHTFSQFGSGTFHGAATHLSRFMTIDPMALRNEGIALADLGVPDPFKRLTIERGALLITPYQKGANRLREFLRGADRHGSCGMGVGETVSDSLVDAAAVPRIQDISSPVLEEKLSYIRDLKLKEFAKLQLPLDSEAVQSALRLLLIPAKELSNIWQHFENDFRLVDDEHLNDVIRAGGPVIFEGAQGMLLDQDWGFHPHTTWSDVTFRNAYTLLEGVLDQCDIERIGITRTYMTRHGAGPFPTEIGTTDPSYSEKYNAEHDWQGSFRVGHLDTVLLRYALKAIGGVDYLALTHTDRLQVMNRICTSYIPWITSNEYKVVTGRPGNLDHQQRLGLFLKEKIRPEYEWVQEREFRKILEDALECKVGIQSAGPTFKDKTTFR